MTSPSRPQVLKNFQNHIPGKMFSGENEVRPSLTVIGEVTDYLIVVEIALIMRIWQTNTKLYQSFNTELSLSIEHTRAVLY